jgi:SsrA-binding protein
LVLTGQEVKSVRNGKISIQSAYVIIKNNEAFLLNANIPPYQPKNLTTGYNPLRSRKLLLHKAQIQSLIGLTKQKRLTLVAIRVYNKKAKIKLEFALARGKKTFDKRASIGKREANRRIQRVFRGKTE